MEKFVERFQLLLLEMVFFSKKLRRRNRERRWRSYDGDDHDYGDDDDEEEEALHLYMNESTNVCVNDRSD